MNFKIYLILIIFKVSVTYQRDRGVNLALGKPTYQSSTILKGVSSNAVDGYQHPDFSQNSCIHTDLRYEPWWYVDLQATFYVTSIIISNRGDCCHERLTDFEIKIGGSDIEAGIRNTRCSPRFTQLINPGTSIEIVCDEPLLGRFVTIVILGNAGILNFCEFEVYGRKPSSVLRLKLVSNGFGEAGVNQKSYSRLFANSKSYSFMSKGLNFKLYDIRTGTSSSFKNVNVHGDPNSSESLKNYLRTISNGTIVCMVLFLSGERYYQESVPYLQDMLGQSITADLEYGESWSLLGYKGVDSPIPHWRYSVRRKMNNGPSVVAKLVTLRQAPSGKPTNLEIVTINGSSLTLTWTRPADYLTDDDYPFDYNVCITNDNHNFCDVVVKKLYYTFTVLKPLTTYLISVQARSADMSGDTANMQASTIESDATLIKVKLISRLQEDAFYRVYGQPFSSILVSGVPYHFEKHGHNFVVLDALTGAVFQTASFNTHEDSNSGSKMAEFIASLPDKVIILLVVYYRAHVYYDDAVASFSIICPNVPSVLQQQQSNALICLKGIGTPSWMQSKISTYSQGPAIIEQNILLPKDLSASPAILKMFASSTNLGVEWSLPSTDKFTGGIEKYEICYSGDFGIDTCVVVHGSSNLQWTITDLHPYTNYSVKIRAAAVLGYGLFSDTQNKTTLEAAPSGPPQDVSVQFVNETSIEFSWSPLARVHQNGIITGFTVCIRPLLTVMECLYHVNTAADQTWIMFEDLQPFTEYIMEVKGRTVIGYGPTANITQMTLTAAPSGPPIDLQVTFINSTTLTVVWSPPEKQFQNGIIQKYKVCWQNNTVFLPCKYEIFIKNQTNYTIYGLSPYTIYDVMIWAGTSAGYGPSALVVNRTSQSAPSRPPSSFSVTFVNSSCIGVKWTTPPTLHHNGIITKYLLTIIPQTSSSISKRTILLDSEHSSYLATNLKAFVNYVIEIRAGTVAGFGPAAITNETTAMAVPSGAPTLVKATNVTMTTFEIAWLPPTKETRNGVIVYYLLCIREFGVLFACNDTRNVTAPKISYLFTNLNAGKEYLVEIKAATIIGYGPSAFVQKMAGKCDNAMVNNAQKISDFQFSASGHLSQGHEPYKARFNSLQTWCEDGGKSGTYLQVDLGASLRILAIATQGDMRHFKSWVKVYNVLYSSNDVSWTTVTVSGEKEIKGNTGEGIVKHYLDEPVLARYVRFEIISFAGPHQCMRVEIFGCAPAVTPNSISVMSWNATSIHVSWQPSKEADTNGEIQGYVICPRKISFDTCQHNKTYTGPDERTKLIQDLEPYTQYALEISSYNVAGEGPSIHVQHETSQSAPSGRPETIEVLATTTNSIRIFWSEIKEEKRNGIITKYGLCYQEYISDHPCIDFHEILTNSRNYLLSGLKAFTKYTILIKAATVAGWGPAGSHIHRTLSAPPSGPPTSVSIKHLGTSVLEVKWSPPEVEKRNGVIVGYRLCSVEVEQTGGCHNEIVVSGSDNIHAIAGLKPYTMYTVSVEARTTGGYGPSNVFHHRTGESIPSGAPADISVSFVNETSIVVKWESPDENELNGVLISYMVLLHEQLVDGNLKMVLKKTMSHLTKSWKFDKLNIKTEYVIEVKAGTAKGFGPASAIHQRTSGEADVTYVKKSNKAYLALARTGIAAGILSILVVTGFFIFVFILVKGYVPYSRPWRKRRKRLWREKIQTQKAERERRGSEYDSEFGSSDSDSSGDSDSSYDGSDESDKETRKHKNRKESMNLEEPVDLQGTSEGIPGDTHGSHPEDIYGVTMMNVLESHHEDIYGVTMINVHESHHEDIYGATPGDIYGSYHQFIYGQMQT